MAYELSLWLVRKFSRDIEILLAIKEVSASQRTSRSASRQKIPTLFSQPSVHITPESAAGLIAGAGGFFTVFTGLELLENS